MGKLQVTLRPPKSKKWQDCLPSLLYSVYMCGSLHYSYRSKALFLFKQITPRSDGKEDEKRPGCGWETRLCPGRSLQPQQCRACLSLESWAASREGFGFAGRLLKNSYSSERAACTWTFRLIALSCKAWQIGVEQGAARSVFL